MKIPRVSCEVQRSNRLSACGTGMATFSSWVVFTKYQTTRTSLKTAPVRWVWLRVRCREFSPFFTSFTNHTFRIMINSVPNLKLARLRGFASRWLGLKIELADVPPLVHKDLTWTWDCSLQAHDDAPSSKARNCLEWSTYWTMRILSKVTHVLQMSQESPSADPQWRWDV